MRPRDMWNRHNDRHEPDRIRGDHDRRDFGQADYSEDYAYDPRTRTGYRQEPAGRPDDYGQADFSRDYTYDPAGRTAHRRDEDFRDDDRRWDERRSEPRSFDRDTQDDRRLDERDRRRGASDRLIRAIVTERINSERRLDSSDIEVRVEDGVVFLDGTARTRDEKRRAEDLADIDDVVDVVNGLRLRAKTGWRDRLGF